MYFKILIAPEGQCLKGLKQECKLGSTLLPLSWDGMIGERGTVWLVRGVWVWLLPSSIDPGQHSW